MFIFNLQRFANIKTVTEGQVAEGLPTASSSVKGGIKIGSGVSVSSEGTLSIPVANSVTNGLMSSTDKTKLNGITSGAQPNLIEVVKVNNSALDITNKTVNITIPNIDGKVDKVTGKGLSTNDFTDSYKSQLDNLSSNVGENNVIEDIKVNGTSLPVINKAVDIDLSGKVDTIQGKGLSSNDYTTTEKNKLNSIAAGAQVNVIETVKVDGSALSVINKTVNITLSGKVDTVQGKGLSTNDYTTAEKDKLSSIAAGAQVNVIETVKVNGTPLTPDSGKAVNITVPDISGKVDKVTGKGLSTNDYTTSDLLKLTSIEDNAQVNKIEVIMVDNVSLKPDSSKAVNIDISDKVDKVTGKGLSTEDFTTEEKRKLAALSANGEENVIEVVKVNGSALTVNSEDKSVNIDISGKVDKVTGKGLSTNDYTTAERDKLAGIADGANNYSLPVATTASIGGVKIATVSSSNISLKSDGAIAVPAASSLQAGVVKLGGGTTNYLRADGFWAKPVGTTYSAATTQTSGLLSAADKTKLDSVTAAALTGVSVNNTDVTFAKGDGSSITVQTKDTSYGTVTSSTDGLVPKLPGGTAKYLRADGQWSIPPDTNTTYSGSNGVSVNGTVISADSNYLGSIQKETDTAKFLNSKGNWAVPPNDNTTYTAGTGISLNGTAINAHSDYLGSIQKGTSTTTYLRNDGSWAEPPNTHHTAKVIVGNSNTVTTASNTTDNTATYLNVIENGAVRSSTQIKGTGSVTVTSASGVISVSGTNTTYPSASTSTAGLMSAADKTKIDEISSGAQVNVLEKVSVNGSELTISNKGINIDITGKVDKVSGKGLSTNDYTTTEQSKLAGIATGATKNTAGSNVSIDSNGAINVATGSTTSLGVLKVGSNLTVSSGTISLNSTGVKNALGYTPAKDSVFSGATSGVDGAKGLVPQPTAGQQDLFLKGDGNWANPAGTTYGTVTSEQPGLVPALAGGTAKYLRADGTWQTPPNTDTNTKYSAGTGISLSGTVFSADSNYVGSVQKGTSTTTFLNNKGEWATPPNDNTTYSAGTGISLSGTTFKADPNYLGSIQKGTSTVTFLNNKGEWATPPGTVTNTDEKVAQKISTVNSTYPILLAATANATANVAATNAIFGKGVKVNPNTSKITAAEFDGLASKATGDKNGNDITTTYLTTTDASSTYLGKTAKAASATTADSATTATTANSATTATTAGSLTAERSVSVSLGSTTVGKFRGNANVTLGVQGTLPVANGGTGATNLSGITVGKANTLTNARNITASLGSTAPGSFNGTAAVTVGTQGILPVAQGGTGATVYTGNSGAAHNLFPDNMNNATLATNLIAVSNSYAKCGYVGIANLKSYMSFGTMADVNANNIPAITIAGASSIKGNVIMSGTASIGNGATINTLRVGGTAKGSSAGNLYLHDSSKVIFCHNHTYIQAGVFDRNTSTGEALTSTGNGTDLRVSSGHGMFIGSGEMSDAYWDMAPANKQTMINRATYSGETAVWSGKAYDYSLQETEALYRTSAGASGEGIWIYSENSFSIFTNTDAAEHSRIDGGGKTKNPYQAEFTNNGVWRAPFMATSQISVLGSANLNQISGNAVYHINSVTYFDVVATTVNAAKVPDAMTVARWDGSYNSGHSSNLTYCKLGAFGTFATINGPLAVSLGGTGHTGLSAINVGSANSLSSARSIIATLGATTAASFNGSANVTVGTQGILPINKGGTGANSAANARASLAVPEASSFNASWYISVPTTTTDLADKVLTVNAQGNTNFSMRAGTIITLYFNEATTGSTVTAATRLNINSTGLKNVYYWTTKGIAVPNNTWAKNLYMLVYTGSNWYVMGRAAKTVPSVMT